MKKIIEKDTIYSIKLSMKHPNDKMFINGVLVSGYQFKNYTLPKGTDLSSKEIAQWFIIEEIQAPKKKSA